MIRLGGGLLLLLALTFSFVARADNLSFMPKGAVICPTKHNIISLYNIFLTKEEDTFVKTLIAFKCTITNVDIYVNEIDRGEVWVQVYILPPAMTIDDNYYVFTTPSAVIPIEILELQREKQRDLLYPKTKI